MNEDKAFRDFVIGKVSLDELYDAHNKTKPVRNGLDYRQMIKLRQLLSMANKIQLEAITTAISRELDKLDRGDR